MKRSPGIFSIDRLIALFVAFLFWPASALAQSQDKIIRSNKNIVIRASDGIASRRCGTLSVNLRLPAPINLRIMAISTYRATITITTDTGAVLTECRNITKSCYATWRWRDMKHGENQVTTTAVGSNNCSMSITSYLDVQ